MNVRGVELELHPSPDYVSDTIRATGDFFEAAILDHIRDRLILDLAFRRRGTIVDVGAMIGNHTTYFAQFVPHRQILAFEPALPSLELLERNVAPFPSVAVHPVALSSRPGIVEMTVDPQNLGHAVIAPSGHFLAAAITLDSLQLDDVTLLKVDVESHEPEVLAGARETIARCRPLIVIEDWQHAYASLLPGYREAAEWERAHQTFLYEWAG